MAMAQTFPPAGINPAADVAPTLAVVCGKERSAGRAGENVTGGVDSRRVHIERGETIILLRPRIAVVDRAEDAATDTELRISSGKDVTFSD